MQQVQGYKKVLIATGNPAKLAEIKQYLTDLPIEFVSLKDLKITQEVEEDTNTYEGNSQKKALFYAKLSGFPTISDDGGLEIAALGGLPGVNARYFGDAKGSDGAIIEKMKQVLLDAGKNREVTFVGVNTLALPSGKYWSTRANVHLELAEKPYFKFVTGFPYRSFLVLPGTQKYFHESELTPQERESYNHRYKALMKLKLIIRRELKI